MKYEELIPNEGWQLPAGRRLPSIADGQMSIPKRVLLWGIERFGKLNAANLWLLMMHNMRLLRGMLFFASKLMPFGKLDRRDTELAILRVAWLCRSSYEWGQHVDIGLRAGLTAEEIRRIPEGAESSDWTERQSLILQACEGMVHNNLVDEATIEGLKKHYSHDLMIELLMLIGWYQGLAGVLNSSGIPLDSSLEDILTKLRN